MIEDCSSISIFGISEEVTFFYFFSNWMNFLFSSKIYTRLPHRFPFSWKSNVSFHLNGKQPFSTLGLTQDSDTIYALCSGLQLNKSGDL